MPSIDLDYIDCLNEPNHVLGKSIDEPTERKAMMRATHASVTA